MLRIEKRKDGGSVKKYGLLFGYIGLLGLVAYIYATNLHYLLLVYDAVLPLTFISIAFSFLLATVESLLFLSLVEEYRSIELMLQVRCSKVKRFVYLLLYLLPVAISLVVIRGGLDIWLQAPYVVGVGYILVQYGITVVAAFFCRHYKLLVYGLIGLSFLFRIGLLQLLH